jgi:integrase
VALEVADLGFRAEGLVLRLRRRKTDQDGQGSDIGIPAGHQDLTCPVRALQTWLAAAAITEGPVFRAVNKAGKPATTRLTDRSVALVVKAALAAAGHDEKNFSGHSLRSGFATSAARAGVPEAQIQLQTGHNSLPVLRGYIRRGSLFNNNAAGKLGL